LSDIVMPENINWLAFAFEITLNLESHQQLSGPEVSLISASVVGRLIHSITLLMLTM